MTHSEPARAGADAYDNMVAWMSMNAPYHHMMTFKAALERSASPAPAAGGLEAVVGETAYAKVRVDTDPKDGWAFVTPSRHPDDIANGLAEGAWEERYQFFGELVALASPAATSAPTYVVNCCNCGRVIDTREESEGGDQWGHELSDDRWVCSPECLDAVTDPDAAPAATSAETQGGGGVREAIRKLIEGGKLSRWLDEDEHVETFELIRAALAPSASAATRGEPVAWRWRPRVGGLWIYDPELEWLERQGDAIEKQPLYASPPAPAVESAQVKEALDVAREYVVDGLSAQDQKRRDVECYPGLMKREQGRLDEVRADLALFAPILAEKERVERNRDMWKGQCERQAKTLFELRMQILADEGQSP